MSSRTHDLYSALQCANPDRARAIGFNGYEYLQQPLTDDSPRIVIQKAAQVGATVLAILRAVWFLDTRQANTMYLFPTHRSAARFSRGRFQVLLEHSPRLREMFRAVKSTNHMRARAANFYCHGARSRVELMSTPVQYLTMDERDELYLGAVTSPQSWSAVELARQRLAGQRQFWELNLSTPTIPGHGVAGEFAVSDQNRYFVSCKSCGGDFTPTWPEFLGTAVGDRLSAIGQNMLEDPDQLPSVDNRTLSFRCQLCGEPWAERERRHAVQGGSWRPTYPERDLRGYQLSQLLSPVITPRRLLRQWRESRKSPQGMQVFFNSVLGLPYVSEGARLERRLIEEAIKRGGYPMTHHSQGSVMGVDVGPNWLHVVVAEPVGESLRLIWIGMLHEWGQLADAIQRFRVQSFVIDAMPETHQARQLVQRFPQGALCWYRDAKPTDGNPWAPHEEHAVRVSRTESLDAMYQLWRLGQIMAPRDLPPEFIDQLQALVRVVRVAREGGVRADYLDAGGADHYAHALNYCYLARKRLAAPVRFEVQAGGMLR